MPTRRPSRYRSSAAPGRRVTRAARCRPGRDRRPSGGGRDRQGRRGRLHTSGGEAASRDQRDDLHRQPLPAPAGGAGTRPPGYVRRAEQAPRPNRLGLMLLQRFLDSPARGAPMRWYIVSACCRGFKPLPWLPSWRQARPIPSRACASSKGTPRWLQAPARPDGQIMSSRSSSPRPAAAQPQRIDSIT